jgi:hypothetical protein
MTSNFGSPHFFKPAFSPAVTYRTIAARRDTYRSRPKTIGINEPRQMQMTSEPQNAVQKKLQGSGATTDIITAKS